MAGERAGRATHYFTAAKCSPPLSNADPRRLTRDLLVVGEVGHCHRACSVGWVDLGERQDRLRGNGSGDKSNKSMAKEGSQPVTQSTHVATVR